MKVLVFLGIVLLLHGSNADCSSSCPTACTLNDLTSYNSLIDTVAKSLAGRIRPKCQEVTAKGADATCPDGFTPFACACGMACGSWDIRNDITCHCQCAGIDWTNAHCCKYILE